MALTGKATDWPHWGVGTLNFAYGSNLDLAQMRERCPASRVRGPARLDGWRFRISRHGYATVVRESGAAVHGLLWELEPEDEKALDVYEGTAEGLYHKLQVMVELPDGGTASAMVYSMPDDEPGDPLPGYLEDVVAAAKAHGFPQSYLEELAGWRVDTD